MIDTHLGNNTQSKKIYFQNREIAKVYYKNNIVYSSELFLIKNGILQVDPTTILAFQGDANPHGGIMPDPNYYVPLSIAEISQQNGYVNIRFSSTNLYMSCYTALWCSLIPNYMTKMSITALSQTISATASQDSRVDVYGIGFNSATLPITGSGNRTMDFTNYSYCVCGEAQFQKAIINHMWLTEWKVYI